MLPAADFRDREHRRSGQLRLFMVCGIYRVTSDGLELSLKLYHAGELQLAHQQLMAEAPRAGPVSLPRQPLPPCRETERGNTVPDTKPCETKRELLSAYLSAVEQLRLSEREHSEAPTIGVGSGLSEVVKVPM